MRKTTHDTIYERPPCGFVDDEGYLHMSVCGLTAKKLPCVGCGFDPSENERRKQLPLVADPITRLRRKVVSGKGAKV